MATAAIDFLQQPLHRPLPVGKVTFEEFIEWCDEDIRAEWVDGRIELMPSPVSIGHQDVLGFLAKTLGGFIELRGLGQTTFAPYKMKLASINRGREPDFIFVKQARAHLVTRNYLDGPADLAIEIASPESKKRDRKVKFEEYAQAGIPEYWLIDPDKQTAEFYLLNTDGHYQPAPLDADGCYHSTVVSGFWLRVNWLWQKPLPNFLDVLRELKAL